MDNDKKIAALLESLCERPFEGITRAVSPRWRAVAIPGASDLFEMTTLIRAPSMRPASMLSAMATKFDPRPERRMPRLCITSLCIT